MPQTPGSPEWIVLRDIVLQGRSVVSSAQFQKELYIHIYIHSDKRKMRISESQSAGDRAGSQFVAASYVEDLADEPVREQTVFPQPWFVTQVDANMDCSINLLAFLPQPPLVHAVAL